MWEIVVELALGETSGLGAVPIRLTHKNALGRRSNALLTHLRNQQHDRKSIVKFAP